VRFVKTRKALIKLDQFSRILLSTFSLYRFLSSNKDILSVYRLYTINPSLVKMGLENYLIFVRVPMVPSKLFAMVVATHPEPLFSK